MNENECVIDNVTYVSKPDIFDDCTNCVGLGNSLCRKLPICTYSRKDKRSVIWAVKNDNFKSLLENFESY